MKKYFFTAIFLTFILPFYAYSTELNTDNLPLCKDIEYDMLFDISTIVLIPIERNNSYKGGVDHRAKLQNKLMSIGDAAKLVKKMHYNQIIMNNELSYGEYGSIDGMLITFAFKKPCIEGAPK